MLAYLTLEDLYERKSALEQQLKELNTLPVYPPPGYRLPYARIADTEERLSHINEEISQRHSRLEHNPIAL